MLQTREVQYVKFDGLKPGEMIAGHLIEMRPVSFEGKRNIQFTLMRKDGLVFKLNGTRELLDKLHPFDIGSLVQITMGGVEQLSEGRKTYRFKVAVDSSDKQTVQRLPEPEPERKPARGPEGEADPFHASDDDIPF